MKNNNERLVIIIIFVIIAILFTIMFFQVGIECYHKIKPLI